MGIELSNDEENHHNAEEIKGGCTLPSVGAREQPRKICVILRANQYNLVLFGVVGEGEGRKYTLARAFCGRRGRSLPFPRMGTCLHR